jgi:hypothetical protein
MKKLVLLVLVCLLTAFTFAGTASASTLTLAKLAKQVAALQKRVKAQATTIAGQAVTISNQGAMITALENAPVTGVGQTQFDALDAKVTTALTDIGSLQTNLGAVTTQVGNQGDELIAMGMIVGNDANSGLRGQVAAHTTILGNAAPLLAIAPYVSLDTNAVNGVKPPNIVFKGANVQIKSAISESDTTGTGNLIVGWDLSTTSGDHRTGSNNLVTGSNNSFTSYGGLLAGTSNWVDGICSAAFGSSNRASGLACLASGLSSTAWGASSVVAGGYNNAANGSCSVVCGGQNNIASGSHSVVTGGSGISVTTESGWGHPAL